MAGVEDEEEFRDAEDGPGADPPPLSSPASTPSKPKPAGGGGGFGRRLLASIGLPTSFSAAIGRSLAPSSPKPPPPQPPAGPTLGLGLLLPQGPEPSADGSPISDASARDHHLPPPLTDLLQQRGDVGEALEEQGVAAQRDQLALQHGDGEDQVVGHDVGVGGGLAMLVPVEEEGREKECVDDGCSGNRNGSSWQDQEEEGEKCMSDELGATMEDQEVEQEGATKYYTAVEDQGNSAAEQCTDDAPRAIKNGNVVEEKEKAVVQGVAIGILGAVEDGSAVGLQEEDNVVVKDQGEDGISVQDQHKVVEQCMSNGLGVAMVDSWVNDQEMVVVEQERVTKHFDAAVEDQSNNTAKEQCNCDELRVIKDGNDVEEKEKAMVQEVSIGILGAANDGVAVGSQEEVDVVVEGQREDGISVQDQHEQCMSVVLRVAMGDSAAHDQELVVVVQEGVARCFDAVREDQSNSSAMEQCTSDEFREVEDGDVVEEMENVVEQEGAIGILDAARDGVAVGEEDVVVEGQGEDVISAQDQHKVVEQCTNDELGGAMGGSTIQDHDLAVVLDQEQVAEYFDTVVGYQSNNAAVEQCTSDESKDVKDDNFAKEKEMVVQQEGATGILGAAEEGIAFESHEEDVVVEGQGENGSLQCQYKIEEQCMSDELEVAMGDCTIQDQEVVVLEQEGIIDYFDAVVEDQSNNASVKQCTSDEIREVNDGNVVEEMEKAMEQEGAIGILGAAENCVDVGLQEEDNVVVEGQREDGISVQDQHKVVEKCISDELGVAMGDSVVQDQEVVGLEQEREYFDAAIKDQCNNSAVEQCTSDEPETVKDGNFVEEKEKAVMQEGAIGISGAAKDDFTVGSHGEGELVVVAEQCEDGIYLQDQDKVVEQCISDQQRTTDVNDAQDQEVVQQEGAIFVRVASADGIAVVAQEKAVEQEQSAGDESKASKGKNTVENKEKMVDQGGVIEKQDATKDGSAVESQEKEDVVVKEQGEDGISVRDQDKAVEQCTSDQMRTTLADNSAEDQEMRREKVRFCVGYPQRPGRPNCRAYMSTGSCSYGLSCYLNHPQLKAKPEVSSFRVEQENCEAEQILELNRVGLPIRETARNCTYYMRNGTCRYGKKCCFNHPDHVLDAQLYKPTGWDDNNLPSSPQSKKSSEHATLDDTKLPSSPHLKKSSEHATLDDTSASSEFLPLNILRMLLPPQVVILGTGEKEMKVKKDPDWSSASDDSDECCSAPDSSGGPLCKQEHHLDYHERPGRQECPFLLRFGNCKFASSCQYYHPKDKFARRYPRQDTSLAEELMVYPDKPDEPECPFYMKTGFCKFGSECKFHHPKNLPPSMQGQGIPKRSIASDEHHPAARTTQQDHMDQQQNYPERPGQPECRYYMQFGKCKFLSACIFHHPKDRVPSMPECPFYMKTGTCQFGSACEFHHSKHRCSSKEGQLDDRTDYEHDYFTKPQNVLKQQEQTVYPERPGGNECFHYMKHGYCKFQMKCKYHHPADRLSKK